MNEGIEIRMSPERQCLMDCGYGEGEALEMLSEGTCAYEAISC